MEEAFYFGDEGKRLFAILHSPKDFNERKGLFFATLMVKKNS